MQKRRERSPRVLGWRILAVAVLTATMGYLFLGPSQLPGSGAALVALAVPFAIGGWVFHVIGTGQSSLRRDVFLGVAGGTLFCAIFGLLW